MSIEKDLGEFDRISHFFAPLAQGRKGAFSLTDDGALIDDVPRDGSMVATMDTLVEGVHFLTASPPETVARKLIGVNLSDLAAMGARPHSCLLSLALPRNIDDSWLASFAGTLRTMQDEFSFAVIGGDTVATPGPLTVTLSALGHIAAPGRVLRRSAARPSHGVCVSGTIGDGALGLIAARGGLTELDGNDRAYLIDRYNHPRPRIGLGRVLANLAPETVGGVCDISDGLLADLGHIGEQSGVRFDIDATRIPLSPATRHALDRDPSLIETVLGGGDDYELVFTLGDTSPGFIEKIIAAGQVDVHVIGHADATPKANDDGIPLVSARDERGERITVIHPGYSHF
ncbi:thiamine-phosphate kinase [Varunaivibrio sulfuroxidans]|uniref:Thiamine-monophosphate kinase n=1 Tax=Varunaivibrio sulfuroxidans TaxID=1773489 RepID=A0A4R3JFK0_9PROT|nr:thiamine-phosphate kinase [Varunaivibrio sulfuroxidans]TCS64265.1 thiamine-phosphate kinase [Varunaivibrio sulfuroxidans]WES31297.1 thiamine-phosphate kinase [Varunaivibrio sulfuroxidans]